MPRNFRQLERIVRGFSNHRRIQMLHVLAGQPELDLLSIARACGIQFKNAAEHTRRLATAGLILKRVKGRHVLHKVSPRGVQVLEFLKIVE